MLSPDEQCLSRIRDYCTVIANSLSSVDNSFDLFSNNIDIQQSIAFSILQIGEQVSRLSAEFRNSTADQISWPKIRGMYNIVVHNYGRIQLDTLWNTAMKDIPALKEFCRSQLEP